MAEYPPRNILLTIAYQGTRYSGWQIQPNVPTVQGALERRLEEIAGHACRVRAAGRTDAGVHALGQLANFVTTSRVPMRGFLRGLNTLLPDDIGVVAVDAYHDQGSGGFEVRDDGLPLEGGEPHGALRRGPADGHERDAASGLHLAGERRLRRGAHGRLADLRR